MKEIQAQASKEAKDEYQRDPKRPTMFYFRVVSSSSVMYCHLLSNFTCVATGTIVELQQWGNVYEEEMCIWELTILMELTSLHQVSNYLTLTLLNKYMLVQRLCIIVHNKILHIYVISTLQKSLTLILNAQNNQPSD